MNEYKASNGITVRVDGHPFVLLNQRGVGTHHFSEGEAAALREFFQHERDEELGRWRWPENPDYVVYPGEEGDVLVYDETELDAPRYFARESSAFPGNFGAAARAYFDAHPEPKPWHDAKPGEVWVITTSGRSGSDERPYTVTRYGTFDEPTFEHSITDESITAGRRIWPEGVS